MSGSSTRDYAIACGRRSLVEKDRLGQESVVIMARENTPPEIKTYNLGEFFTRTYLVPAYQRNYSWTRKEVDELFDDLFSFFSGSQDPYYLLGDVIVVETKSGDYDLEIIDGQQRVTTLTLLLSSIYSRLRDANFDEDELGDLRTKIKKKKLLRVKMSGNASEAVLSYIDGQKTSELPQSTPSQRAVVEALEAINAKLDEFFPGNKPGSLHDFVTTLQDSVYVSRLHLNDRDSAYEFFERVNDRGKPLSKTDLLKNRLLQKIKSDDDFENASEVWASAEKLMLPFGREGSMPFLLRQMLQADTKRKIKDSQLYKEWKPRVEDDASCQDLIDRIEIKSSQLANILSGKTPRGDLEIHTAATSFLKFTQNYGVRLAGGHLSPTSYDLVSRRIEARALLSLLSVERSQTYENLVVEWSYSVNQLSPDAGQAEINKAIDVPSNEIDDLLAKAKLTLSTLRYGKTPGQTNRIRLVLAIANDELLRLAPKQHADLRSYLETSRRIRGKIHPGYDIEHIGASSHASTGLSELSDSIGNLTLFYSTDNRSQGAANVEFKAADYGNSICYATKILTSTPDQDSSLEKILSPLRTTTVDDGSWGIDKVNRRFEFYWGLVEGLIRRELVASTSK